MRARNWHPWIPGAAVDELLDTLDAENDRRRQRAGSLFDAVSARFKPSDVSQTDATSEFSANFVEQVGEVRGSLAVRGRLADLIVTARPPIAAAADRLLMPEVTGTVACPDFPVPRPANPPL
jgi:hypothetical protein